MVWNYLSILGLLLNLALSIKFTTCTSMTWGNRQTCDCPISRAPEITLEDKKNKWHRNIEYADQSKSQHINVRNCIGIFDFVRTFCIFETLRPEQNDRHLQRAKCIVRISCLRLDNSPKVCFQTASLQYVRLGFDAAGYRWQEITQINDDTVMTSPVKLWQILDANTNFEKIVKVNSSLLY